MYSKRANKFAELKKGPMLFFSFGEGYIDAIAEGPSRHRLGPVYLIWKNPKFEGYPEPSAII